jgi:tRNA (cmo5U34)-methyltransferase
VSDRATERRFQGAMSEDYLLIRKALPQFDELQRLVAEAVARYCPRDPAAPVRVLDLGCGDGITSGNILARCPNVQLTALDSERSMVAQASHNLADAIRAGRCRVVLGDALTYLRDQRDSPFDVVASALALHNLHRDYRRALHGAIYHALRPGGRFISVDNYVTDDGQRFERLYGILQRFFDAFAPLGKWDLLRAAVLHEVADDAPDRVMRADDTVAELTALGFADVALNGRYVMASLLEATRPG